MMNSASNFKSKPAKIRAIQWTGDNEEAVAEFTNGNFYALNEQEQQDCDDPEATGSVFDVLHATHILVYTGNWIIEGTKGENYPCVADVFEEKYEEDL